MKTLGEFAEGDTVWRWSDGKTGTVLDIVEVRGVWKVIIATDGATAAMPMTVEEARRLWTTNEPTK